MEIYKLLLRNFEFKRIRFWFLFRNEEKFAGGFWETGSYPPQWLSGLQSIIPPPPCLRGSEVFLVLLSSGLMIFSGRRGFLLETLPDNQTGPVFSGFSKTTADVVPSWHCVNNAECSRPVKHLLLWRSTHHLALTSSRESSGSSQDILSVARMIFLFYYRNYHNNFVCLASFFLNKWWADDRGCSEAASQQNQMILFCYTRESRFQ